jgi:hypothetical protein
LYALLQAEQIVIISIDAIHLTVSIEAILVALIATNESVFAKAGNSLIVQPGTNAELKICC